MSKDKDRRTLEQLLLDVAYVLFPAEDPPPKIDINTQDSAGDTALHVYLWREDDHAARELIRHGADVNVVGDMGETPLHVAARRAEVRTLAALLAAGANSNVVSEFNQTPEALAKDAGRLREFREALNLARDHVQKHRPQGEA